MSQAGAVDAGSALAARQVRFSRPARRQSADVRNSRLRVYPCRDPSRRGRDADAKVTARGREAFEAATTNGDGNVRPLGVSLLSRRGPSAVRRRVGAVRVFAIDRVPAGWTRTHVGQKQLERLAPTIAHDDAASAPVGVVLGAPVLASPLHRKPRSVFGGHRPAALVAVLRDRCGPLRDVVAIRTHRCRVLARQAAARPDRAVAQVRAGHQLCVPAVAEAQPHARLWCFCANHQSAESRARQLNQLHRRSVPRKG